MGNASLAKNPVARLLVSGSAIVGSTIYGVCTGDAFTSSTLIISSVLDVIKALAPEVLGDAFHDKFVHHDSREDILRNGDLARAVGSAISLLIAEESKNPVHGNFREIIRDFGKPKFLDWEGYAREAFDKQTEAADSIYPEIERVLPDQLTQYFDKRETDLDGIETLTREAWEIIVKDLFNRKKYYPTAEVVEKIAERLHKDFARALRKVLVDDFSRDGKAYASMQLRIVGEILSYVKEIHQTNRQILKVVLAIAEKINEIDEKINTLVSQSPDSSDKLYLGYQNLALKGEDIDIEALFSFDTFLQKQADALNFFVVNQVTQIFISEQSLEQQTEQTKLQKRMVELLEKLSVAEPQPPELPEKAFNRFHPSFPQAPHFFTGREQVLKDLEKTLEDENQASFYGTHGLGKTRTAIEYALRHAKDYDYILFISATKGNFVNNAAFVGAEISDAVRAAQTLEAKYNLFVEYLQKHPNWLIICDNVEDVSEMKNKIPKHFQGNVIYTSNLRDISGVAPRVTIEAMTREEAKLTLLRRKLEDNNAAIEDISAEEQAAIAEIVEKIATLPIALNLAGAFMHKYQLNFREYLRDYQKFADATFADFDLADYYGENFLKGLNNDEKAEYKGIAGVFLLSYERIIKPRNDTKREKQISQTLEVILNLSAFLAPEKVPEEIWLKGLELFNENLANAAQDTFFWLEVRERLTQAAFFVRNEDDNTSTTHRLIQAILQKRLTDEEKRRFAELAVDSVNNLFPKPIFENWKECNRFQRHAEAILNHVGNLAIETENVAQLYNTIAYYIDDLAEYEKAVIFYQKALKIDEKISGKFHLDYVTSLNNLAIVYQSQGKYDGAIKLFEQVLEIGEKLIGKEHSDYAVYLNNLANTFLLQGRYDEAVKLLEQALEIGEKTIGKEHLSYATRLNNLANIYQKQGKYNEAVKLYLQVLEIGEKTIGKNHPTYSVYLSNVALVYGLLGKYDEATKLYKQILEIDKQSIGTSHPEYAKHLNNLAFVYYLQDRYEDALFLFEESLLILGKTFSDNHPYIQTIKKSIEICRQVGGKGRKM